VETIAKSISENLKINYADVFRLLLEPVKEEYGDFAFPLLRYTKNPDTIIFYVNDKLDKKDLNIVNEKILSGFINFIFKEDVLFKKIVEYIGYGNKIEVEATENPKIIVVEHTSANPIHPLHMGHARNACIGDTLFRLLSARGHKINTRFYVDDMGRQSVLAALGFKIIGKNPMELSKELNIKPDKLVGWVYAVSTTTIDAMEAKMKNDIEEAEKLGSVLVRLRSQDPGNIFDLLFNKLNSLEDPEKEISNIMVRYEKGLEPEKTLVRSMANSVLEGFKETLSRLGIFYNDWDWESDILWKGLVDDMVERAKKSKYFIKYKDADAIDIPRIIEEIVKSNDIISNIIKIPKGFDMPPLILRRSDGSTLYTTRDMAYTIYKFKVTNADRVINVIGTDQRLPQLQLRLALLGLGYERESLNLMHYDYEIVRLPGKAMHGRRGEYVTLDEVLDEIKNSAIKEIKNRNPDFDNKTINEIAENISIGAIRYAMIQLNASKPLTFDINKVLNLRESSGPYLQYTYVRSINILEKHGEIDFKSIDYNAIKNKLRRSLFLKSLKFSLVAAKASDDLSPEDLASYLINLSDLFNQWYEADSVLYEKEYNVKEAKAFLVYLVKQVLEQGMHLLGIPIVKKL
jgi:arginyl-tRNA synthetase